MTDDEIERRKLHRTWFTWPAWVYYAIFLQREYEEMYYEARPVALR